MARPIRLKQGIYPFLLDFFETWQAKGHGRQKVWARSAVPFEVQLLPGFLVDGTRNQEEYGTTYRFVGRVFLVDTGLPSGLHYGVGRRGYTMAWFVNFYTLGGVFQNEEFVDRRFVCVRGCVCHRQYRC